MITSIGRTAFIALERKVAMKQIFRLIRSAKHKQRTAIRALLTVGVNPLPALKTFNMRILGTYLEQQTTYILRNTWETLSRTV